MSCEGAACSCRLLPLERVTKPTKPDPPRGSTVKKHVRPAASRSVMGSCRTVLANSIPSVTWRTPAGLRSRVPHRHYLRPSQRHSLADAPARTRVRVGDDVPGVACATGSWRVCGISSTSRHSIGSRDPAVLTGPKQSWTVLLSALCTAVTRPVLIRPIGPSAGASVM